MLEVTFGSSQLFDPQTVVGSGGRVVERTIPVTSALLMVEWLARDRLSVLSLFNLPLTTQKRFVDGEVSEDHVAASIAAGVRVSAIRLRVFAESHLELQLAALAGTTIGSTGEDRVFPLLAARIHFANRAGFALYLGGAFAFRKDTLAVLYGIGHRF